MKFKNDWKLYLDDVRPCPEGYVLARSYVEAIELVQEMGCPSFISFDHDLGLIDGEEEKNGYSFAKWLVNMDLDHNIFPNHFNYQIHSSNPEGRKNINGLFLSYFNFKKKD